MQMFNFLKGGTSREQEDESQSLSQSQPSQAQMIASKILSRTGQAFQDALRKDPHFEKIDQQILETLIEENRNLKSELESNVTELEELKEKVDTLNYLEQEASEENEVLRYKVMRLEGQAAIEGQDISDIKIVDELRLAKKEIQGELDVLRTQVKSFKMLFGQNDQNYQDDGEDGQDQQQLEDDDPMIQIGQLKMLYDHHKIELSDNDQVKIISSLYLKEQVTYRYYREKLFEKIAKKAIEQAEFLYKNRGSSSSGQSNQQQSRIFMENKRLKKENEDLSSQILNLEKQIQANEAQAREVKQKHQLKLTKLQSKIKTIQSQLQDLQTSYQYLKQQNIEASDLTKSYLKPNLLLLDSKVKDFQKQMQSKIQEVHKAVFDKNKAISDLFNKNNDLQSQLNQLQLQVTDTTTNNKLIYDKNKQIGDLFNQTNSLKQELDVLQKLSESQGSDLKSLKHQLISKDQDFSQQIQDLKLRNEQLDEQLRKTQKESKIQQVIQQSNTQQPKEVEEARKAVYEKNKQIGEMFNKQKDMEEKMREYEQEIAKLKGEGTKQQSNLSASQFSQKEEAKSQEGDFLGGFFSSIQKNINKQIFGQEQSQEQIKDKQITSEIEYQIKMAEDDKKQRLFVQEQALKTSQAELFIQQKPSEKLLSQEKQKSQSIEEQRKKQQPDIFEKGEDDFFNNFSHIKKATITSSSSKNIQAQGFSSEKKEQHPRSKDTTPISLQFKQDFQQPFKHVQEAVPVQSDLFSFDLAPKVPEQKQNLEFLNDMFSNLLGDTVHSHIKSQSVSKPQENLAKGGWNNGDDLDIDNMMEAFHTPKDNINAAALNPNKVQVAEAKLSNFAEGSGWGEDNQEIEIEEQIVEQHITLSDQKKELDIIQNAAWGDNEDILIDELEADTAIQAHTQEENESHKNQSLIDKYQSQEFSLSQQQDLQPKDVQQEISASLNKGWGDDNDIDIDDDGINVEEDKVQENLKSDQNLFVEQTLQQQVIVENEEQEQYEDAYNDEEEGDEPESFNQFITEEERQKLLNQLDSKVNQQFVNWIQYQEGQDNQDDQEIENNEEKQEELKKQQMAYDVANSQIQEDQIQDSGDKHEQEVFQVVSENNQLNEASNKSNQRSQEEQMRTASWADEDLDIDIEDTEQEQNHPSQHVPQKHEEQHFNSQLPIKQQQQPNLIHIDDLQQSNEPPYFDLSPQKVEEEQKITLKQPEEAKNRGWSADDLSIGDDELIVQEERGEFDQIIADTNNPQVYEEEKEVEQSKSSMLQVVGESLLKKAEASGWDDDDIIDI